MTAPIELEETHKYLRNKLDILGFNYPLPIGAISLVGALIEDLIKTTESLRTAKDEVIKLREEKEAWDLGVEPYKCDNSRLLAECNALHQELIKQREKSDIQILEITRTLRNLELDKHYLEEHCAELNKKLRNFESKYSGDASKSKKDSANMHKKPFVTAVRRGELLSNPKMPSNNDKSCFKMICNCERRLTAPPTSCTDIQKLENEYRDVRDTLNAVHKQLVSKEREIERLTNLINGGRTPVQLARECCYKGIHDLAKDLDLLQKEKIKLQGELKVSLAAQHEAMQRATMLEEKNRALESETDVLEKTALEVESRANMALDEQNLKIVELQKEVDNLRKQSWNTRLNANQDAEKTALKSEIKKINDEYRTLVEKLNECSKVVENLQTDNQKLTKKNSKLKLKLSNLKEAVEIPKEFQNDNKNNENQKNDDVQRILSSRACEEELARIRGERDYYQKEYLKIVEHHHSHENLEALRSELKAKDLLISQLQNNIELLKNSKSSANNGSQSVNATINRLERERDALKLEIQKLKGDRNLLQEKSKILSERQLADQREHASQLQDLYVKLSRLEMEKNQILSSQVPTETTVNLLGSEIEDLKQQLIKCQTENEQLKKRYNQIKTLQEQTERSLTDQQSRLRMSECVNERLETKFNTLDTNRELTEKQVAQLKGDLLTAKTTLNTLEREKEKCTNELDSKTERIIKLETELRIAENDKRELQKSLDTIKKRYDEKTLERISQDGTLREATTETHSLRKQISSLKHYNDNAMLENNRLTNELGDTVTALTITKRQLKDSEMEVEKLKLQLQQYVQEVKRVEDMLAKKDNERAEMLDHFRSLSQDAVVLEGNNHSLEIEATETKKQLIDAENRIIELETALEIKRNEFRSCEQQINNLSRQIDELQIQLETKYKENLALQNDLTASKLLVEKLDLQRDSLAAELEEHSTIRQQLQTENQLLKLENNALSGGSGGDRKNRLAELLESSRQDIDQHIRNSNNLNQEVIKLRRKTEDLQSELSAEQTNSVRSQALAHEYSVQLQELRQELTNERFNNLDDMDKIITPAISIPSDETIVTISDSEDVVFISSSEIQNEQNVAQTYKDVVSTVKKNSRLTLPSIFVEGPSNDDINIVEIFNPNMDQPDLSLVTIVKSESDDSPSQITVIPAIQLSSKSQSIISIHSSDPYLSASSSVPTDPSEPNAVVKHKPRSYYDFSSLPPPPPPESIEFIGSNSNKVKLRVFAVVGKLDKLDISYFTKNR